MSTTEPKKPRKPRAPRRNFATERAAFVQYCKMMTTAMSEILAEPETPEIFKSRLHGKVAAYREVLAQMGEAE